MNIGPSPVFTPSSSIFNHLTFYLIMFFSMDYSLYLFTDAEMKGLAPAEPSPESLSVESDEVSAVPCGGFHFGPLQVMRVQGSVRG